MAFFCFWFLTTFQSEDSQRSPVYANQIISLKKDYHIHFDIEQERPSLLVWSVQNDDKYTRYVPHVQNPCHMNRISEVLPIY